MECANLENWRVCWKRRKKSQGWTRMVTTRVKDIPCMLAFLEIVIKKKGSLILESWKYSSP